MRATSGDRICEKENNDKRRKAEHITQDTMPYNESVETPVQLQNNINPPTAEGTNEGESQRRYSEEQRSAYNIDKERKKIQKAKGIKNKETRLEDKES